ncbi:isochorismatase family cysteine hydrolase [Gracilibacillus thailandensis]|jgi:nicotinamidase-related amidase|uniref:Isochorismatase family protein n=1 Tax=Gracilibacillus thailandensis TaxID=563735 RepID=A0A6N7R024_9BACI|nr:isochorismatase family cysteine hydrolase [Gracilibacillus thailandensis]MRI67743.1 isochorismatase family protein [Gracilibacillus thailandensis]
MNKTAVLFIDLINDFTFHEGDLLLNNTRKVLPNIKRLKQYAKERNYPIIYINDHYDTWETDFKQIAQTCLSSKNEDIIEQGMPDKEDYFIMKPQMSGFFRTPLRSLLEQLEIRHLIIAGIAGNICVLFTANDAHMRGYTLHVPENCVASNTERHNQEAIKLMAEVFNAETKPI